MAKSARADSGPTTSQPTILVADVRRQVDDEAIREGLVVWRKLDKHGQACASCHSPDGIELAAYDFDSQNIRRRAANHLLEPDGIKIDQMILALRDKFGFKKLLDPMVDRPMQPGGAVLPGSTPIERDLAFAKSLNRFARSLMGGPISSDADAVCAQRELARLDCRTVPIGIPMNRISEDGFHGAEHATIASWLPDVPPSIEPSRRRELTALADGYLENPTTARLQALDAGYIPASRSARSAADQISLAKYRAMLLFQHSLRTQALGKLDEPVLNPAWSHHPESNPMWEIGDLARVYERAGVGMLGFPPDVQTKKSGGPTPAEQMKELRLAWFWAGWLCDPSLQNSGPARTTQRGDYFTGYLWKDGPYPAHNAFMITKKLVAESTPTHFRLDYSGFLTGVKSGELVDPVHRSIYRKFVCNSFRMSLYLLRSELVRSGGVHLKEATLQQARSIGAYLAVAAPARSHEDAVLVSGVLARIVRAKELGRD